VVVGCTVSVVGGRVKVVVVSGVAGVVDWALWVVGGRVEVIVDEVVGVGVVVVAEIAAVVWTVEGVGSSVKVVDDLGVVVVD
jgi:hypothetical protein